MRDDRARQLEVGGGREEDYVDKSKKREPVCCSLWWLKIIPVWNTWKPVHSVSKGNFYPLSVSCLPSLYITESPQECPVPTSFISAPQFMPGCWRGVCFCPSIRSISFFNCKWARPMAPIQKFFFKWTGSKCAASSYKLIRQKIVVIPYKQLDRLYHCQTTNFQIPLCMLTQQHRHHTIGGETQKAHTGQRTQRQCTGFLNIERQHTQLTYEDMLRSSPTLSCITDPKVTQWAHLQIVDLTVIHLICNLTEYSQQRDSSLDTRIMTALVACSKT